MRKQGSVEFQGTLLSVEELLRRALAAHPETGAPDPAATIRHTAATNAQQCAKLLASGGSEAEGWRFGILQTLDDYRSAVRRGGLPLGVRVFIDEPPATGSTGLDAAFAALADFLAERDGWTAPGWALDAKRRTPPWYPDVPDIFRADADAQSPRAFRQRGIFIPTRALWRA